MTQPISKTVCLAIKNARKRCRWTQDVLAKSSNISRSLIASIERGTTTSPASLRRIYEAFPSEVQKENLYELANLLSHVQKSEIEQDDSEDMLTALLNLRQTTSVDLSGRWDAIWLTSSNQETNFNSEAITFRKRWDGSWQARNDEVSAENPDGGYLWVGHLELFDNQHLLGYYLAREPSVLAKGTLCLQIQTSGKEIIGTWEGMNFDTMWANGMVVLCKQETSKKNPRDLLNKFMSEKPLMPHQKYLGEKS